ncbi:MAG: hypothetical protein Fur0016_28880 [Anaerolineales bacterium]
MPRKPSPTSAPDEILTSEFKYIANTAFQANEDRARATSFYLVTFGSFIAALLSAQLDLAPGQESWLDWGFSGLFAALALMGLVTVLELARLRAAWFESIQAMNTIKEYYIARHPDLSEAIKWRSQSESMPNRFKFTSVGFLMALQVAFLGGAALGAGVFFLVKAASGAAWLLLGILSGVAYFLALLEGYRLALK